MIIGANVHPAWEEQKDRAVREAIRDGLIEAGVTSVRLDFAWDQIEPTKGQWNWTKLDDIIDVYSDEGMTVVPMLYWPPAWAVGSGSGKGAVPRDPAEFGRALGMVAQRYGSKLAAVEMWNEPDLDVFWKGTPQKFAQLLAGAYPVAKEMAPNVTFLAAAPTYLGLASNWFRDMYATGIYGDGKTHDEQAIHPYMSPSDLPPDAPATDWSINGIGKLQDLRSKNGDTSSLWATEFGWSTHTNPPGLDPWKLGVTEQQHADFTVGAFELLEWYEVKAAHVYTDRDMKQTEEPHERNFGLLFTDNNPKKVIAAMAEMETTEPPEPPDPDDGDTDARLTALETRVSALEAQDAQLSANLQKAASDLA